jgi:translocation and assembly module TamB
MSEFESMPPVPPEPPVPPAASGSPRRLRRILRIGVGAAALLIAAVLGLFFWANSPGCEDLIRKRLVARIEAATGGRVEIASFHWRPLSLEADAGGLVIHGLEAAGEAPYARVQQLRVRLSVLGFWSPRILLRDLDIAGPQLHLIVYPDGSTNQPHPRKPRKAGKPALDTLFDLKAGHVGVEQGTLDYENRAASFDFQDRYMRLDLAANDVSVRLVYVPAAAGNAESYRVEAGARDFSLVRGNPSHPATQPVEGYLQGTLDLTRNAAYLRWLRVTTRSKGTPDRFLDISGSLTDFGRPRWQANVVGDLDMRLLEPATGYPFTPEGTAHLNLAAQGQDGQFRVDGNVHAEDAAYVGTGVTARGVRLDAHVHADPEQLLITSIVARLHPGGEMDGAVALEHWLPPIPGAAVLKAATPPGKRSNGNHKQPPVSAPVIVATPARPAPTVIPVNGKVTAQLKDVTVDTILDMVSLPPFQRLGLDARLNGPATATWTDGDNRTLAVGATLSLSPSKQSIAGESPTSGTIDGTYTQRDGAVDLRTLDLILPASHLEAHGHLGAYPLDSPSALAVDFHTRNLGEFDKVLRDLGLTRNGKSGTAALPVALGGQTDFHGTWAGSLASPHIAGSLKAANLNVELPPRSKSKSGPAQFIRLDTVDASGSYSESRIAIDHGELRHGQALIYLEGILTAAGSAPSEAGMRPGSAVVGSGRETGTPAFDANSLLHLRLRAAKVGVDELMPLAGQSLPIAGQLNAQIQADGPIHALGGSGWVELDGGAVYGEPVASVRAQGKIVGQTVQLASLTVNDQAGKVTASGSYNLKSRQFQIDARGAGIDVARIQRLRQAGLTLTGKLGFSVTGSGTLDDPRLEGRATMTGLTLSGESVGGVEMTAHAANHNVTYDVATRLANAELSGHGQTALGGDYATQATLSFSQFNIGALLSMAHIPGLTGESSLAGTVTVAGPLAHPEQLHGDARLQELAATVVGVHLHSQGSVHATLANARVNLDPLHITGEQTDLHLAGSLALKDQRRLDIAASGSINMKLAETLDPDLTASGTTTFQVEAHGPLQNPGLSGRIDFQNASLALEDLPNSLSQLHGTLEFNQNRLEVKSLTAMSGGGLLSVSGYLAYQHGIFADLSLTGKGIRIRYPQGVSSLADATLQLQGTQNSLLLSGGVLLTRFTVSPDMDFAALATQAGKVQPVAPPDAPSNHVRLDVHILSSQQLNFQNAFAKLAGDVDLRLRGTLATPSLLGRVSITEGSATIAGTRYELQRGDITFNNPVRIEPSIDLNATAHAGDYDITLGLHGSLDKMAVTYRSDPPLPEADVVALLALGRTQNGQRIYTQQQEQIASNPTTDALLGGALNATVSSRVQKLFGAGSVKVDPSYLGALGNSTTRITVEEQLGRKLTLTYATNVNTTAQQLLQAEIAINRHVSLLVARDESGVFSMVIKATRRYR